MAKIRILYFLYFQYKLYKSVIDDVVNNVREAFIDEGVDEQVLQDLKQVWYSILSFEHLQNLQQA